MNAATSARVKSQTSTYSPPTFVVGYDFEEHSLPALDHAIRFACTWPDSRLVFVWATDVAGEHSSEEEIDEAAKRALDKLDQAVRERVRLFEERGIPVAKAQVTPRVAEGSAAKLLRQTAQTEGADVIVLGSGSKGTLQSLMLGSVSRSLMGEAPCSVLVCRERQTESVELDPPPSPGQESTLGRRHTYHYESRVGRPGTTMPLLYPMK